MAAVLKNIKYCISATV